MFRRSSILPAALALVSAASIAGAQIPGSFGASPTSNITLQAQKPESFALTLSSTVQTSALTIADSTSTGQQFTGAVTLTPTWDLANNRTVTIYGYVSSQFTTGAVTFANSVLEASATSSGSGTVTSSWTPFSSTVDGHASGVTLYTISPAGANLKVTNSSQALQVSLRLNTTNTYVVPGTYTGIVTFGAKVQ